MAAFAPDFTATQDQEAITFADTSNWTDNDEGYLKADYDRSIVLTDAYGVVVSTQLFDVSNPNYDATDDIIIYPLATNNWFSVQIQISGAQSFSKTKKIPFQRVFELAYANAVNANCDCGCQPNITDGDLCSADTFYQVAAWAVPIGDGVTYQTNIDAAYNFIK